MDDQELLKKSKELQEEAKRIIEELGILKILGRISEPEIVGSVRNGLMVLPDIDIHNFMEETNIRAITGLMPEFAILPTIQKVQFSNYREFRRDYRKDKVNFPRGYYLGLRSIQPSGEWKIDMWFGKKGELGNFNEAELEHLTAEQRLVILRLKEEMKTEKGYKEGVSSTDFYKAVFHHGVKNLEEFQKYLKES